MAGKKKAIFKVEDVIVSVACPHCKSQQCPPRYPNSFGWDFKDLRKIGLRDEITCGKCGEQFPLPQKLFNLLAGL